MPHNAARYIEANIIPQGITHPLNYIEAAQLEAILQSDAKDYFYSATISTANAYSSIERKHYSWATVQLYYSNFYILRGLLALKGVCIFYHGYKPYSLVASVAETAKKPSSGRQNATTHGMIISIAKNRMGATITSGQTIAASDPLDWMKERREEANYWHSKLSEPIPPPHLKNMSLYGIRKLVGNYINDSSFLYTYDPDHAIVAYNLFLWDHLRDDLIKSGNFDFSEDELIYMRSLFADDAGPLNTIHQLLVKTL